MTIDFCFVISIEVYSFFVWDVQFMILRLDLSSQPQKKAQDSEEMNFFYLDCIAAGAYMDAVECIIRLY